jgi:hypothetical protein
MESRLRRHDSHELECHTRLLLRSTWRSTQATEDSPLVEGVDSLKRSV